jgi:hypothetical protein
MDSGSSEHKQYLSEMNCDNKFQPIHSWNMSTGPRFEKFVRYVIHDKWARRPEDSGSNISGSKDGTHKRSTRN